MSRWLMQQDWALVCYWASHSVVLHLQSIAGVQSWPLRGKAQKVKPQGLGEEHAKLVFKPLLQPLEAVLIYELKMFPGGN